MIRTLAIISILSFSASKKENVSLDQSHWYSYSYVECLNNMLPCQCKQLEKSTYTIKVLPGKQSKQMIGLMNATDNEFNYYDAVNVSLNKYQLSSREGDIIGLLEIMGEELTLKLVDDEEKKFIKSKSPSDKEENVRLINQSLKSRNINSLEELLNEDLLKCDCNVWLGNMNIVYIKGRPNSWIISIEDGFFILSKMQERQDPDDPVVLEELSKFAW